VSQFWNGKQDHRETGALKQVMETDAGAHRIGMPERSGKVSRNEIGVHKL